MRKTAVIDIDNTLWQFCDAFYLELKKLSKDFPEVDQWSSFDFWEPYCSREAFMAAVNEIHLNQDSDRYRPYPEARGFLSSLRDRGFTLIIASHRMAETRGPTERWLSRHRLPHDELHLSFDKTVLFDHADIVVDDSPETLKRAVAKGAKGAGLLFPWNRSFRGNGFGLFPDLAAVLRYLLEPTTS